MNFGSPVAEAAAAAALAASEAAEAAAEAAEELPTPPPLPELVLLAADDWPRLKMLEKKLFMGFCSQMCKLSPSCCTNRFMT